MSKTRHMQRKLSIKVKTVESNEAPGTVMMISDELVAAMTRHALNGGEGLPPGWSPARIAQHTVIINNVGIPKTEGGE